MVVTHSALEGKWEETRKVSISKGGRTQKGKKVVQPLMRGKIKGEADLGSNGSEGKSL